MGFPSGENNERANRSIFLFISNLHLRVRKLVLDAGLDKGVGVREIIVLVLAYVIFDYGLRVGQSYEISSSNQKLQNCQEIIRGKD